MSRKSFANERFDAVGMGHDLETAAPPPSETVSGQPGFTSIEFHKVRSNLLHQLASFPPKTQSKPETSRPICPRTKETIPWSQQCNLVPQGFQATRKIHDYVARPLRLN
jgi:hypothetical protein